MPAHTSDTTIRRRQGRHGRWRVAWRGVLVAALGLALAPTQLVQATSFHCPAADVVCLIAAIHAANSTLEPDTIQLAAGTYMLTGVNNTTDGANGLPSITSALTIQGAGADQTVLERASSAPSFRLVHVASSGNLTIDGLILRGGGGSSGPDGGGLFNDRGLVSIMNTTFTMNVAGIEGGGLFNNGGTISIINSTFSDNGAIGGGGLANLSRRPTPSGTVHITNSTFSGNGANEGGGLLNYRATLILQNATVVDNFNIGFGGGGIDSWTDGTAEDPGSVVLQNTILARNENLSGPGDDCAGPVISLGHNLIGDPTDCTITLQPTDLVGDPGLGVFTDDGQPGRGHYPPLPDSPVIDVGDDSACPETDQLGQPRLGPCDIGAVEFQPTAPPSLAIRLNQSTFQPGETLRVTLDLSNPGPTLTTDVYVGIILPDGVNTLFLTNFSPIEGVMTTLDSDPRTFPRLLRNVSWPSGLRATQEDYFTHTFTGLEPFGTYHLLVGWTRPGSLDDGAIHDGDVLALAWAPFSFTRGSAEGLYTTMRAIRERHANK
jgi:uncharacterized repeat protein (TIGR01451 family)